MNNIEEEFNYLKKRISMLNLANELAKACYDECVYNFKLRSLTGLEKECFNACSQKYFSLGRQVDEDLDMFYSRHNE